MTRQKRQRAERPFARVVSDKQEAAATIADRRVFHAFGGAGVRKYQLGRVRLLGF
jgi:hypothetical protein